MERVSMLAVGLSGGAAIIASTVALYLKIQEEKKAAAAENEVCGVSLPLSGCAVVCCVCTF
jgi:NH3-dependent NAD+ synthetase